MVTEGRQAAPYAPTSNVLEVIRRFRERGLPDTLSLQELERIGVPAGNAARTLATLRFLSLVDEDGRRTEAFERLGRAATGDYSTVLAEVVREAYRAIFTVVDPAKDSDIDLSDAFRHFAPQAQRERMISLFLGLCREAGIVEGGPPERRPRRRRQSVQPTGILSEERVGQPSVIRERPTRDDDGADYRLIAALMQQLPRDGKWTKRQLEKWLVAVRATAELVIEVEEEE